MKRYIIVLLGLILSWASLSAQQDPIQRHLYPPELIMKNQLELNLSTEQRKKITDIMTSSQTAFTQVQWQLEAKMARLQQVIAANTIDEQKAMEVLEQVLELENRIKMVQLRLMIRVKNTLTPEQRGKLDVIKQQLMQKEKNPSKGR